LERQRQQELAADRFALDVLMSAQQNTFCASYTVLAHLIIMQDNPERTPPRTHPADHDRLMQIARHAKDLKIASDDMERLYEFAAMFDPSRTGAAVYDVLDTMAANVTRETLQVWKGR